MPEDNNVRIPLAHNVTRYPPYLTSVVLDLSSILQPATAAEQTLLCQASG